MWYKGSKMMWKSASTNASGIVGRNDKNDTYVAYGTIGRYRLALHEYIMYGWRLHSNNMMTSCTTGCSSNNVQCERDTWLQMGACGNELLF